jgi:hypothetical protein
VWFLAWAAEADQLHKALASAATARHDAVSLARRADDLGADLTHLFPGLRASVQPQTGEAASRPQVRLAIHAPADCGSSDLPSRVRAEIGQQRARLPHGMHLYAEPTSDPCGDGGFASTAWHVLAWAILIVASALLIVGWPGRRAVADAEPSHQMPPSDVVATPPPALDPPLPSRHTGWPV